MLSGQQAGSWGIVSLFSVKKKGRLGWNRAIMSPPSIYSSFYWGKSQNGRWSNLNVIIHSVIFADIGKLSEKKSVTPNSRVEIWSDIVWQGITVLHRTVFFSIVFLPRMSLNQGAPS